VSTKPNASICGRQHSFGSVAGQTLPDGNSADGEFSKAIESSRTGNPDIPFTILEKTQDHVPGEAVGFRKYIRPALMHVDESSLYGSDPETSIAITEQPVRIDVTIRERSRAVDCSSNRIRFELVANKPHESSAVQSDQQPVVVGFI
jgi:hypothetical protein